MEGKPGQAHTGNGRTDNCTGAICLVDGDQRTPIQCAVAIAAVHRQGWRAGRRSGSRSRRRRCWTYPLGVALASCSRATGSVAEVLSENGVILLHSGCGTSVPVGESAVDDIEASLSLIQPQLEVGTPTPREVLRTPLYVEDAVGRCATYRGEDAEPAVDQIQIIPVWRDVVVVGEPRQTTVGEGRIRGRELRVAVGRQINARKALIVQRVREWQRDGDHRVIPVIADVRRAGHDATTYLAYRVLVPWRTRRRR